MTMSSPSSGGSVGGKRKRTNTITSKKAPVMDQLQASSRDASGEDGESTAPEANDASYKKTPSTDLGNPPAKRLRSSTHKKLSNGPSHLKDFSEPSDTTEGSTDIINRVGRKAKEEDGDKTQSMAPPPIGKLTDPVGYKTNPPPIGRAVRVYADGVFDLFHLGYVSASIQKDTIAILTLSLGICDS